MLALGALPKTLEVDGVNYPIRTDYRNALLCYDALINYKLSDFEKSMICLRIIFKEKIPPNTDEAIKKVSWFLDYGDSPKPEQSPIKIMDWKQDESMIFSAVNKAAGVVVHLQPYIHWWSFLGFFQEIPPDSLYAQILRIRKLIAEGGKDLTIEDKKFIRTHRALIDINTPDVDDEEENFINSLINKER
jgi:hypothetical protein